MENEMKREKVYYAHLSPNRKKMPETRNENHKRKLSEEY